MKSDQRRSARRRVLWGGALVPESGHRVVACTIRSISVMGAQVRVRSGEPIPDKLILVGDRNRVGYWGQIVWHRADLAGIEFDGSFAIDGVLSRRFPWLTEALSMVESQRVAQPNQRRTSWLVILEAAGLDPSSLSYRLATNSRQA